MSRLSVYKISKSFNGRKVVNAVSYEINNGEVVGLLGPNGAGKTTSFYISVGLLKTDSGSVLLNDTDITKMPIYKRARLGLGYLPQEASVFRKLTVEDNLLAALESQDLSGTNKREKFKQLAKEFRIEHILKSFGYSLSGGERRRVEIARALAGKTKFLLLDEPFAGIDPIAVEDIQEVIRELKKKGIGVLITDHSVRETLGICDRAYILKEGKIELEGTPEEIVSSEVARKFYLGENFKL